MKEVEFYSKAHIDASFRQQELEETAYQKKMTQVVFGIFLVATAGYVAYCGIVERRLPDLGSLVLPLVLCGWGFTKSRTKLAALQAINFARTDQTKHPL